MFSPKIILIGPCGTGKSKFLQTATGKHKLGKKYYYVPTIGVDVFRVFQHDVDFLFWDCSGNYRYEFMIKQYTNSASAIVYFTDDIFDENLINALSTKDIPKFVIFTKAVPTSDALFFGWYIINGINKKESEILTELLSYFKKGEVDDLAQRPCSKIKRWFSRVSCFKRVESYSSFKQIE